MKDIEYDGSFEQHLCEKATKNSIPISGILELTPCCNMDCDMCFVRMSPREQEKRGNLCSLKEWINIADAMKKAGTLFVLITGGEPLLYPDFRELYLYLKKMGMIITINTNGTLIDDSWIKFFEKNPPRRINITLYGKDEKAYETLCHYGAGFSKTMYAIRELRTHNVEVKLNGSITHANKKDSVGIKNIAKELCVPCKLDTYMYPGTREREKHFSEEARLSPSEAARIRVEIMKHEYEDVESIAIEYLKKIEEMQENPIQVQSRAIACRAGRSSYAINWQGNMRPCIFVTRPEKSVRTEGFVRAWNYIVEQTAKIKLSAKCARCELRNVCQVCAASALLETGSYEGTPKYMCQYTEETIHNLKEILKKKSEEEGNIE